MGMGEAGRVLPVTAQMLGLRGFAQSGLLPTLVADVHVIDFLQVLGWRVRADDNGNRMTT
eukprot:2130862-Ditylum_brightwellii.AAC.1